MKEEITVDKTKEKLDESNNIALTCEEGERLWLENQELITISSMQEQREINFTDDMTWEDFKAILKEVRIFVTLDKDVMDKIDKRFLKDEM